VYEAFFGLVDAPFRLTPDPRFLYLSAKHAEALAHLRLGLSEPGGFVCITGDIGTGKTTVLRTFLDDLGPDVSTAYVFNPTLSWEDLLERIARELGVPATPARHVDMMDELNAHLLAQRKEGRISVVVIDEAQAIPLEVLERLRLLSNLETTTEKLLRLVLVGQPQLARILIDPSLAQLNQRITLRWHLRPLTRAETFAYVRHRLRVAGGDDAATLFTVPALLLVHRYATGVPRLVNMIGHRATLAAYVRRRKRVGASAVRRAYREIRAVPLTQTSPGWRLGWVAAFLAIVVGVGTIGMPRLRWATPIPTSAAPPATMSAAEPVAPAPVATVVAAPAPAPIAAPVAPVARAEEPRTDLEEKLAGVHADRALRSGIATVLAAWQVEALRGDETADADALEAIAHRRGLEDLRLTGNLSMLRLLDLPALLELRLPGTRDPYYVVLTGIEDDRVTLKIGDETVRVDPSALDRVWFGDAHVIWRDFEWLGPTFGSEAKGEQVTRLQRLLTRANVYGGQATGAFDASTQNAVVSFQRSRRLDPDCRVGRLTRIALYGAAGGYKLPTLASGARAPASTAGNATQRGAS
jgi:general secretion pathway protein A